VIGPTGPLRALPTLFVTALLLSLAFVGKRGYHPAVVLLLLVFLRLAGVPAAAGV